MMLLLAGPLPGAEAQSGIAGAGSYAIGTQASGAITENGPEKQCYRFTLDESGAVHLTGAVRTRWVYLRLYDANAEELDSSNEYWNSTSELIPLEETVYLTSGTYYSCIERDGSSTGTFNFRIDFTSSNESFREGNGGFNSSLATANQVATGATFYDMRRVDWALYDENGQEPVDRYYVYQNDTTKNIVIDEPLYLISGTYYLCFEREGYDGRGGMERGPLAE